MNNSTALRLYVWALLAIGVVLTIWGSAVSASVGGLAMLALGAASVAAGLVLIGVRMWAGAETGSRRG
ncbi:hypothetical protein [Microbacterium sp. K24]|uniref:hypothetical protein n=1 Tax=Microbacterium sp. K24 TaxID=2305446 RepID=UPI00109C9ADF|nr:hypothetical protein [Microbacterium sp. K24]